MFKQALAVEPASWSLPSCCNAALLHSLLHELRLSLLYAAAAVLCCRPHCVVACRPTTLGERSAAVQAHHLSSDMPSWWSIGYLSHHYLMWQA